MCSPVATPTPIVIPFGKNCQRQQSSCPMNFDCWQYWGKSSGTETLQGRRHRGFSHSLPYHWQIALTYCCYRLSGAFFGPCEMSKCRVTISGLPTPRSGQRQSKLPIHIPKHPLDPPPPPCARTWRL